MTSNAADSFWNGFFHPPVESRPRVWWHWMNGNIDIEGIKKDLDWLEQVGVGGVQIFEGGMGAPQATPERLVFRTEKWYDAFIAAVTEAKQKNIEVSIASSGGWSVLGAPFVKPENAMKKFVWSQTQITSGPVKHDISPLPNTDGNFQDMPKWGQEAGVIWAKGQQLAIGQLATEDENRLELTLTSAWRNRLIGDEHGRETSQPGTYLAYPIFEKHALPMSAGLNKPAILWI